MAETYKGEFHCTNCGWKGSLDVPKGMERYAFSQKQTCGECGTPNLHTA